MRVKTTQSIGYIRFEKALDYGEIKNILESSKVELHFNPKKRAARVARKVKQQPKPMKVATSIERIPY